MTVLDFRKEVDLPTISNRAKSILCWGSAGSGKSSLAVNLAFELANNGWRVCLIDADTYHPSVAALLGMTQANGGLAAILRLLRQERFDDNEYQRLVQEISFSQTKVSIVTGIPAQTRWSEVDPPALNLLIQNFADRFDFIVWDTATYTQTGLLCSESGRDRNQATAFLLAQADLVLATFLADPVGLNRFLFDLREVGREVWPVANRLRSAALGRNPQGQVRSILSKTANLGLAGEIAEDEGFDIMLQSTKPLLLQNRASKAQQGIRRLAQEIAAGLDE